MSLQGLVELLSKSSEFDNIIRKVNKNEKQLILGLSGTQRSILTAALANDKMVTLFISHNQYQAELIAQDLRSLLPERGIFVFNPHELLPHEEATIDWELKKSRLDVLKNINNPGSIICTSIQALSEALIDPKLFYQHKLTIDLNSRVELAKLTADLVKLGYERVDMVEGYGQFSIRGGIIDIFSYTEDKPVRIELFDDQVDSIRLFEPEDQISVLKVDQACFYPARERIYSNYDLERLKDMIWADAQIQSEKLVTVGSEKEADTLLARVAQHLEILEQNSYFGGIDQYLPYFSKSHTLLDYLPKNSVVVVSDPVRIKEQAQLYLQDISETISGLLTNGRILPKMNKMFFDWYELWQKIKGCTPIVYLSVLDKRISEMGSPVVHQTAIRSPEHFQGNLQAFVKKLKQWRKSHYRVLLVVSTEERGRRLADFLRESDVPAKYVDKVADTLKIGNCIVTTGSLGTGFEYGVFKLVICTDLEIYGKKRVRQRIHHAEDRIRLTQTDLTVGDYVVHENHGIGQYLGVETLKVQNTHKDYLLVKFAGKDRLYVPTDQIDLLQRYVGLNDQIPKLSKLGGGEWARIKKRVKDSVKEMAEGLIQLYAAREATKGFSFPKDSNWQKEFDDAFPYDETPDQIRTIEEVKRDMERPKPMDRLLCGDVGYGKTEVAIRAAFKAVEAGKQAAVLVPTTILAQQHSRTFQERFENYPIRIEVLSRFQSASDQRRIVKELKTGNTDIVIGTHRLLSKDVSYHDLGLVVVDEEQRFGVAQKERLKEICKDVDVLTLSATPIPRTLHMSMVGVRDMSLIETPPEDRFPIRTYVMEWDDQTIVQAIMRELGRQGQVYFVFNRVQGIDRMHKRLRDLVPEARVAVAHGQMDENRLERVMLDFYQGEYDVLLCTTIIETGMDISNVNTLIIYDADYLGLAQLYQLRGRVGRTNRVAYAYFTYRKDKILTEDAEKRLQAIKEFSELGSGIKIAMRDLEIRGAGNILGPEQHGFISSVGFELYCKLLDEAIKKLKGETKHQVPDPVLDLHVDAYIGDSYVTDPRQKVELYKKIVAVKTLSEADDLEEQIQDRFGDLPNSVRNLLLVSQIKVLAREVGVASIFAEKRMFVVRMLTGLIHDREKIYAIIRQHRGNVGYVHGRSPQVKIKLRSLSDHEALTLLKQVLQNMK